MLKWIEATGRSEDAAVQNALAQLGLDRDSVSAVSYTHQTLPTNSRV